MRIGRSGYSAQAGAAAASASTPATMNDNGLCMKVLSVFSENILRLGQRLEFERIAGRVVDQEHLLLARCAGKDGARNHREIGAGVLQVVEHAAIRIGL